MNVALATRTSPSATNARFAQPAAASAAPSRHPHRQRDFGVGYGNSSGYASTRQYASNWAPPRFKFA